MWDPYIETHTLPRIVVVGVLPDLYLLTKLVLYMHTEKHVKISCKLMKRA